MDVTPTAYRAEYRQRTQQTADDLTGCLWCGQPLPASVDARDPRMFDEDQSVRG